MGAAIIVLVKNNVSAPTSSTGTCCSAFVFLLIIMFMPEGLVPGVAARVRGLRRSGRKAPVEAPPHA